VAILDVLTLSGLYTLRLLAGAAAVRVVVSDWLLIFSIFLFLSLALVKRVSELLRLTDELETAHGRGYAREDLALLRQLGAVAGYLSVLVLALYIQSPEITALYSQPEWLWLVCPLALYWISRVWLVTHRGQMNDDPVVYALRDRASLVVAVLGALLLGLAA
jgi:4-hydroxybenzoate polyprenyltransferase